MINVKNLRKTFGTNTAVDGISFNVEQGEVLGFLGPNGAGKSTTMPGEAFNKNTATWVVRWRHFTVISSQAALSAMTCLGSSAIRLPILLIRTRSS